MHYLKLTLLGILLTLFSTIAEGYTLGPSVRSVTFSVGKYEGIQYDPYLQYGLEKYREEQLQHTTEITADFDVVCNGSSYEKRRELCIYLDNSVFAKSTDKQYRYVAWEFELGFSLSDIVDFFYHHKSEHVLEDTRAGHFPLANYVGIRIEFVPNGVRYLRNRR